MEDNPLQATLPLQAAMGPAVTLAWYDTELFAGQIYVGCVVRIVPENWRDMNWFKNGVPDTASDFQKKNHPAIVRHHERFEATPFRAWLMTDENGEEIGTFATLDGAKNSLAERASSSLTADCVPAGPRAQLEGDYSLIAREKTAEVERLREALAFYADPANYEMRIVFQPDDAGQPVFDDGGDIARAALQKETGTP